MKLLASLLVTASLVVGVIAASTSYVISLDAQDEELIGLRLKAPFGVVVRNDISNQMIGRAGMRLSNLDAYNARVKSAQERLKDEGFDESELNDPPPPPVDTLRTTMLEQDQHLQLAIYDALINANVRPSNLRPEQDTRAIESAPGKPVSIWPADTKITPEVLAAMREYQEATIGTEWERDVITVKEFAFDRWQHRWWFIGACFGLLVGAVLLRSSARKQIAATALEQTSATASPAASLNAALADLKALQQRIAAMNDPARDMIASLDAVQSTHFAEFIAARPSLIQRLGMGGYAELMDTFAGAERQLNRAWSAAADHVFEEARQCLDEGIARLADAIELTPAAPR